MFKTLRDWLRTPPRRPIITQRRRTRLNLEALEDRFLPTAGPSTLVWQPPPGSADLASTPSNWFNLNTGAVSTIGPTNENINLDGKYSPINVIWDQPETIMNLNIMNGYAGFNQIQAGSSLTVEGNVTTDTANWSRLAVDMQGTATAPATFDMVGQLNTINSFVFRADTSLSYKYQNINIGGTTDINLNPNYTQQISNVEVQCYGTVNIDQQVAGNGGIQLLNGGWMAVDGTMNLTNYSTVNGATTTFFYGDGTDNAPIDAEHLSCHANGTINVNIGGIGETGVIGVTLVNYGTVNLNDQFASTNELEIIGDPTNNLDPYSFASTTYSLYNNNVNMANVGSGVQVFVNETGGLTLNCPQGFFENGGGTGNPNAYAQFKVTDADPFTMNTSTFTEGAAGQITFNPGDNWPEFGTMDINGNLSLAGRLYISLDQGSWTHVDTINVSGKLTINNSASLVLFNVPVGGQFSSWTFITYASETGEFGNVSGVGHTWLVTYLNGSAQVKMTS